MKVLTNSIISSFIDNLDKKGRTPSDVQFRISTAISFINWLVSTDKMPEIDATRFKNELYKAKHRFQSQKAPISNFPLKYVGISLAVLSLLLIGGGIYMRFYKSVRTPFAYSSAPVRAGRIISFQGRMTDTLGNPITAPIDVTYKFYTVPTGGSVITDSTRVCTASPDQDGIFNTLIGNDSGGTGGTACNVEIPTDVFTTNTDVYLGVTIGTEITEMTPRQQIANVGYAINSETLQGMPPGQGVSNIPYINTDGNMLIAASNPGIRSITSSNFTISSALATTIQSAGSGDITLSATEGGNLRFNTYNGTLEERMTILNTGRVGIGITVPRALLDVNGDATVSGSLIAGGVVKIGDFNAAPSNVGNGSLYYDNATNKVYYWNSTAWAEMGSGGVQYFQRTLGSLAPTNITDDFNLGAVATSSAIVHLPGLTNKDAFFNLGAGNVGIGLINPAAKLDILGNLNVSTYATVAASLALGSSSAAVGPGHLNMSGDLTISGAIKPGGNAGANGYLLTSSAGGVNTWTDPTTLGAGYNLWQRTLGSIAPLNITDSLNLGATATSAALIHLAGTSGENSWINTGNVGIGNISPNARLDVTGSASISGILTVGNGFMNLIQSPYGPLSLGYKSGPNAWTSGFTLQDTTGNVGIGTSIPISKLDIDGNLNVSTYATVAASLALGSSSAAAGPGNLDMSGDLTIAGAIRPGGNAGANGFLLTSSAGGVNTWTDPSTFTSGLGSNWIVANGVIRPLNSTLDLLLGGTSSASAKFAFLNNNTGTPTASVAGSLANVSTYLTGDGNLATTNMAALTVGSSTTGSVQLSPKGATGLYVNGSGDVGVGTVNPTYRLDVSGTSNLNVFKAEDTAGNILKFYNGGMGPAFFEFGNSVNPTVRFATNANNWIAATSNYNLGVGTITPQAKLDVSGNLSVSTYATVAASLALGTANAAAGPGNLNMSGDLTISGAVKPGGNAGVAGYFLTSSGGGVNTWTNPSSIAGVNYWNIGSGSIYPVNSTLDMFIGGTASASAKFAFLNSNSGTPTASIAGLLTGDATYLSGTGTLATTNMLPLLLGAATTGPITIGANTQPITIGVNTQTLSINTNDWDIGTTGNMTGIGTIASNGDWTNSQASPSIFLTDSTASSDDYSIDVDANEFIVLNSTDARQELRILGDGSISIGENTTTKTIRVGGNTNSSADTVQIATNATAADTITIGNNNAATTLSVTGGTAWSIDSTGNLSVAGTTTLGGQTYTWPGSQTINYVLKTNGSGGLSWVDANTLVTSVSQYWQQTLGSLAPANITNALNLGAIATGSALVHLPGTNNADAWFNLGTGNVGIGNNAPTAGYKLHVTGDILANGLVDTSSPGTWFINPAGASNISSLTAIGNITAANASVSGTLTVGEDQSIGAAVGKLKFIYNSLGTPLTGMTLTNTGRIGIGTENPDYALDVVGNIKLSSGLIAGTNGPGISGYVLTSSGGGVNTWTDVVGLVGGSNQWQRTLGSLAPLNITDAVNIGAIASGSAIVHLPGTTNNDVYFNIGTGKVGIGNNSPSTKLDVSGNVNFSGYATMSGNLTIGNGSAIQSAYGPLNLAYKSGPNAWTTGLVVQDTTGNVGIGTTSPSSGYKLDVNGSMTATNYYDRDDLTNTYFLNPAGSGTSLNIAGNYKMKGNTIDINGTGTTTINSYDTTNTVWTPIVLKGSNDTTSTAVCIEGTGTGGTCDGKLNVGTVDPPYTINGKRYATYLPSMTGVKEETTGKIELNVMNVIAKAYTKTIHLNNQVEGSDLWLFAKTTTIKDHMNDLTVLISANTNAKTWYSIDDQNKTLTFYSSAPTELSYRLTAPRFDSSKWANTRGPDDLSTGFIINDEGNMIGSTPTIAAAPSLVQSNNLYSLIGTYIDAFNSANEALFAKLTTGLINTQKIVSPLAEIETLNVSNKIKTPLIETSEINSVGKNITIALNPTPYTLSPNSLSQLIITGLNNTPVATIDSAGNATFAGTLTAESVESSKLKAENLEAENASVSGTLVAKNIQSETIDALSSQIASSTSTLATNYQLLATDINSVQAELAAIKSLPLPNPAYYQNIDASYGNLTVNDTANIYKAHIAESLVVGTLFIQPSSILALSNDLRISSLGTIRLFDDAVVIAKNGDLTMKGEISASSLAIKNTDGIVVASINASGSAKFSEVIANKFSLSTIATQGAYIADSGITNDQNIPIPAIKTSTEVAGNGTLPQDIKEVIIYNENVTNNSLIYLTPTTNNLQGQLSVTKNVSCPTNSTCNPYFVVSSNIDIHSPISFNWLIIN